MENMFCFQCEQTVGGVGCTGMTGACGKQATTSNLQDNHRFNIFGESHSKSEK